MLKRNMLTCSEKGRIKPMPKEECEGCKLTKQRESEVDEYLKKMEE
jgi:hypothetical protein